MTVDQLAARYFAMWNTGETHGIGDLLHPSWRDHAHPEVTGPDAVARSIATIRAARPDLRFHVDTVLTATDDLDTAQERPPAGSVVAVVGRADLGPPTEPSHLMWLFRVEDGRLAEMWTYHRT